ncbi:MAG: SRPBCC domain-containing protein [Oculatellaceae cyanobacterium Prado106]|jgi:hypothetical protein|nr:SRPBCC domain-containing protein [Oculatellaceae cyanobacterium Prado106]
MPSLYASVDIQAPRAVVWRSLIHKETWLQWNTFLYDRDPDRPFAQGRTVNLSFRRQGEEAETEFEAKITLLQPGFCLRWVSIAPGYRSEHTFELQDIDRDRTRYTHQETLSGLITHMMLPFLRKDQQQGIRRMARQLKYFAEETF